MSLLLIAELSGLFVNTLTADDKFFVVIATICQNQFNWNCLKKKLFVNFLLHFWNQHQTLNNLKKRRPSQVTYFRNYRLSKTMLDQCPRSPVTEHPSTVILLKVCRNLWILHDSTSMILFITPEKIEFENVSVSNMWNLQTLC